MNYLLHNEYCVKSESVLNEVRNLIDLKVSRMMESGLFPATNCAMDLYFSLNQDVKYLCSALLNIQGDVIYLREEGHDILAVVRLLFDRIKLQVLKRNYLHKRAGAKRLKEKQLTSLVEYTANLQEMKKDEARDLFNSLLGELLRDVARYIRRRLKAAEMTTAIRRGRYKMQELLDELYILFYEKIDEIPADPKELNVWIYRQADNLLEDIFNEMEFERSSRKDVGEIADAEYRSLEENFTVDADEEIIELEELDEFPGKGDIYYADDLVYGEDEDSLLDDITLHLNRKEIHLLIEKELAKLPIFKRTVMDLYLINQLSEEEIADMKSMSIDRVESVIREVNKSLKDRLKTLL